MTERHEIRRDYWIIVGLKQKGITMDLNKNLKTKRNQNGFKLLSESLDSRLLIIRILQPWNPFGHTLYNKIKPVPMVG